ncbi:alanine:cation symporter family protein [Alginatibacterium sediminis]|uniref:Alanine:cation symporter family protein n=1 Tax=Alginatibacterium sediminis TaxID=2164068 RepID=A0A420EDZ9_9ALTE|nr:alanine/glycine:cation symporter family protein [Alginatibacterium sediminis]RKF18862.1 alanine:cation symporter family protein [Alginatibacterium sediminis]
MSSIIDWVNNLLWGNLLIFLLIGTGLLFTVRTGFIQFRHFGHMFKVMKSSRKTDSSGISSFQALCTSLAARVGTGNLAGVAIAVTLGGPGAVFWMWLIAILGMATSFAESSLAQLYKTTDDDGNYRGGPSYYMEKGLGKRWMGVLFSVFLIVAFGLVFNAIQANSIAGAIHEAFGVEKWIVGIVVVIASALVIFGGIKGIARFAEVVVPIMALAYVLVALAVIIMNISEIPAVFALIFKSAFGFHEAGAGAVGAAMMQGIKRGLFSNEAGMGSAPNAAATATPYPPHPASQGYVQMLGVFVDTIVICTATAAIILLSYDQGLTGDGIALTQQALSLQVGSWGSAFVGIAIIFFAFTSIVGNYSYAETNLIFLEHNHKAGLLFFRLAVLGMVMFGALVKIDVIWNMADVSMGMMAIINLVAILMLSGVVVKIAKDYNQQLDKGQVPHFNAADYPELDSQIESDIWNKKPE